MLEVIDKGCVSESHPVPLLFVHGAWHAAWCWDENFLSYFADKGYRALAVSFRGHGDSPTYKPLRGCSVADYVADVRSVADRLPSAPVVIGHSMGGLIVQKYLESHDAPAGVLMTSIPPQGNFGKPALDQASSVAFRQNDDHRQGVAVYQHRHNWPGSDSSRRRRRRPTSASTRPGCKMTARASASTACCCACPGLNA